MADRPVRDHGGALAAGVDDARLARVLDLSVNVNPYGPAPEVLAAARRADATRYPDPTGRAARAALAGALDTSIERIALGNGAAELLWTLSAALLHPGDVALVAAPTFSELPAAARARGARVVEWRADPRDRFAVDLDALERTARDHRAALLYLCAPNNPTGAAIGAGALAELATSLAGTTVIVDQAFLSLSERHADRAAPMPDNVALVRSMTKDHAIPGLRAAYLVAAPALVRRVEASRPAWTTSAPAQAAIVAATGRDDLVAASRARLLDDRDHLVAALGELDLAPLPSSTFFVLVRVGDGGRLRAGLFERHDILVRDCRSFGLPGYVRIAAPRARDLGRLVGALERELGR